MAKFILDGQEYGGGGSGSKIVKLTQAEYDALSNDKLSNDTIYLITDSGELAAENLFYDGSQTGLGNNVQGAIDKLNSNLDEQNKNMVDGLRGYVNPVVIANKDDLTPLEQNGAYLLADSEEGRYALNQYAEYVSTTTIEGNFYRMVGADAVFPFKKGYEDTPGTATAELITKGFTAWVNGELITGTRALPVNSQTGSKSWNTIAWDSEITFSITFPTPFDSVPAVSLAGSTCTKHDFDQLKVTSVSRTGFTGLFEPGGTPGAGYSNVVIRWTATTG